MARQTPASQSNSQRTPRTTLELVKIAADFLRQKGIEAARLDAELLLAHALKCERITLYTHFDKPLAKEEVDAFRELIRQRANRVPTKYLTGRCEFASLDFEVNPSVLIPRPETEFVVTAAVDAAQGNPEPIVIDIGTGCGNIAVAMAKALPSARIFAGDISPEAVATAERNVKQHGLEEQIVLLCGDMFEPFSESLRADVIVSNPPYIRNSEFETLQPEIRLHEPAIALKGGDDGLDFYRRIAAECKGHLKGNGFLVLEMGQGQRHDVQSILHGEACEILKVICDYSHIERVIVAKRQP